MRATARSRLAARFHLRLGDGRRRRVAVLLVLFELASAAVVAADSVPLPQFPSVSAISMGLGTLYGRRLPQRQDLIATSPTRIYVAEGDSITANGTEVSNGGYVALFAPNAYSIGSSFNNAASGSRVSDLNDRAAALDRLIAADKNAGKFILSVLVGHNDLYRNPDVSLFLSSLAGYLDRRRAAGWTVAVGTLLPSTAPGFNTLRNTANDAIRSWAGAHAETIIDFAADPRIGPDVAASNTEYYSDGTHPTDAGHVILEAVMRGVIYGLR